MMYQDGNRMWYAILDDISLVPVDNRLEAYTRLYDQMLDVIGSRSPSEFKAILQEILMPQDWHKLIESNS